MNKFLMLGVAAVSMAVAAPAMAEGPKHKGKGMDLFAMHDTNNDGVVTKAEFLAKAEEHFAKLDTDGDGQITKAEHDAKKAAWKEKREEHRAKKKEGAPAVVPPATE